MPKIPSSNFRTRLSLDVPRTPTRSIQSAGIVEGALANVGQEVANFGLEIAKRRELSERDAYVGEQSINYALESEDMIAQAKKEFTGDNLKGMTEAVKERLMDSLNERLSNAPSTAAGRIFRNQAISQMQGRLSRLNAYENAKVAELNRAKISKTTSNIAYAQYQMPDPVNAENLLKTHFINIDAKIGNDITPDEGLLLKAQARSKVAQGTIFALMREGRHEEASRLVNKNYLGAFSDAESTEKMRKTIQGEFNKFTTQKLKLEREQERKTKQVFEDNENRIYQELLVKKIEGEDVEPAFNEYVRSGQLSTSKINLITRNIMNAQQEERDDEMEFFFNERISTEEDISAVERDVKTAVNSGMLSADVGSKVLTRIQGKKKKQSSDPAFKARVKLGDTLIKSSFPTKMFGVDRPGMRETFVQASLLRDKLVESGVDPVTASRSVIKKFKSVNAETLVPRVPSELQKDPVANDKAIMAHLKSLYENGKISKEEAKRSVLTHMEKVEFFKNQDAPLPEELLKGDK